MSLELLNAVFKSNIKPSSLKFVLLAMSDYANEQYGNESFAAISTLASKTGLDRKTVQKHLIELERRGLISDTGNRKGATNSIKIWTINSTEILSDPKNGATPIIPISKPKNGTTKRSQKRVTEPLSSLTIKERLNEKSVDDKLNAKETELLKPDPVDSDLWKSFMELRTKKKAQQTKRAMNGLINKLIECNKNSISMNAMIDLCLQKGWIGVNYLWYQNEHNVSNDSKPQAVTMRSI